ncbi:MAG: hypothetical protein ACI8Q1_003713 [Parvicella sp.]|jgi:hypothetical protein
MRINFGSLYTSMSHQCLDLTYIGFVFEQMPEASAGTKLWRKTWGVTIILVLAAMLAFATTFVRLRALYLPVYCPSNKYSVGLYAT